MIKLRKRKLSDGKQSLYLDIYVHGKRDYEYLNLYLDGGIDDKNRLRVANEIKVRREFEIMQGSYISSRSLNISFYEFYDKHKKEFPRLREKDVLVNYHMKRFRPILSFKDIDVAFWKEFKQYFIDINHKPYTIFTSLKSLKAILNSAVKLGVINDHLLKNYTEKRPETYRVYLTFEELKALDRTECRKPHIKNAFLFCCYTGLRYGDLRKLTFADIKNNQVEIKQEKTKVLVYIPLSVHSLKYLPDLSVHHEENDLIFPNLASGTVHAIMKEWSATAGITKNMMFHTSRHTFATMALTYGVDIETVSSLLGHTDIKTTQIYAKIVNQKKINAINNLPSLGD